MTVDHHTEFIRTELPEASAAMLCGSHANGTAQASSDVDMIVFSQESFSGYHYLTLSRDEQLYEITVFSRASFVRVIEEQCVARNNAYLMMIKEGVVLFDEIGITNEAKQLVGFYTRHYLPFPQNRLLGRLHKIYSASLKGLRKPQKSKGLAHTVAFQIAQMASLKLKCYERPDYELIELMSKEGPDKEAQVLQAYFTTQSDDFKAFFNAALDYLKPLGEYFIPYSTGQVYDASTNNRLSLAMPQAPEMVSSIHEIILSQHVNDKELFYYMFNEYGLQMINFRGERSVILGLKHTLEKAYPELKESWITFPYIPIAFSTECFYTLEDIATVIYTTLFLDGSPDEEVQMTVALSLLKVIMENLPSGMGKDLIGELKEFYLVNTLPLYHGFYATQIAKAEQQHIGLGEQFARENQPFFEAVLNEPEEPLRSLIEKCEVRIKSIQEIKALGQSLETIKFLWSILGLSDEQKLLLAFVLSPE
ncbi:MAG: hypothetical protein AAFX87_05465 [Bacteroidota bacterium]